MKKFVLTAVTMLLFAGPALAGTVNVTAKPGTKFLVLGFGKCQPNTVCKVKQLAVKTMQGTGKMTVKYSGSFTKVCAKVLGQTTPRRCGGGTLRL